jgi:hypothetical protein
MEPVSDKRDGASEMEDVQPSQQEVVGDGSSDALLEYVKCGFLIP